MPKHHQHSLFDISVLLAIYIPVAVTGYVVYGTEAKANIMQSLPEGNLRTAIEALITTHLVCAFVIILSPVSQDMENTFDIPHGKLSSCIFGSCHYLLINKFKF